MNKLVIFVCLLLATTCQAKFNLHALLQKFESDLTKALDAKDGIKFKDCGNIPSLHFSLKRICMVYY